MRLSPRAEAKTSLRLSQFASHLKPVGPLPCGSVWHRSGEAAVSTSVAKDRAQRGSLHVMHCGGNP